jgi:hypothetical protein
MEHAKKKQVYKESKTGLRVVNIPDLLLQLPKNLVAYAYASDGKGTNKTVKAVKFAVYRQPIPTDYVCEQDAAVEDILMRLELLESLLKDVEAGAQQFTKFDNIIDAATWAKESGNAGDIIVIKLDIGWVPHVVEDDKSLSAICNCDGDEIVLNFDGDDANGYEEEENYIIYDGGNAAGI